MATTGRTRFNVCRSFPTRARADVRTRGDNSPGGFPLPMLENVRGIHIDSVTACGSAGLFSRDPLMPKPFASHRSSQRAPERAALRPVRQARPHDLTADPGSVHQRRRRRGCYRVDDGLLRSRCGAGRAASAFSPCSGLAHGGRALDDQRSAALGLGRRVRDSKLSSSAAPTFDTFRARQSRALQACHAVLANR